VGSDPRSAKWGRCQYFSRMGPLTSTIFSIIHNKFALDILSLPLNVKKVPPPISLCTPGNQISLTVTLPELFGSIRQGSKKEVLS